MMNQGYKKYKPFTPIDLPDRQWPNRVIDHAPIWCSVDLRDGNQALVDPMNLEEKLEYFKTLIAVGFKEIEVGFPSASETEYEILRTLIDGHYIPDDVTIQVLVQARPHLIKKTFEAIDGAKNVIVHFYNSTSTLQRKVVFKTDMDGVIQIAVDGARLIYALTEEEKKRHPEMNIRFEYSPESFTGTEPEFALEICNAVLKIWEPTPDDKVIINLPVTVSHSMPHVYANQIEYMNDNLYRRENVVISLHPHNDRGCAVADSELGLLAGGDRIEGTLFGNGERTGNVDIITLALNMYSQGVDPELDFSNMPEIVEVYERVTRMHVYERSPYSGQLVFAAFSGSHQDAIAKGMHWREEHDCKHWNVPYLPINPEDVGRVYEADVIRINSQSGKGGVSYLMETKYGYHIPMKMRESFGYLVKGVSDHAHKELLPEEVLRIFEEHYVNIEEPISLPEVHFVQKEEGMIGAAVTISYDGKTDVIQADGNGRLDAVSNAVKAYLNMDFALTTYTEHALAVRSNSKAVSYVGLEKNGKTCWGVGIRSDIINSSISAFLSALNQLITDCK